MIESSIACLQVSITSTLPSVIIIPEPVPNSGPRIPAKKYWAKHLTLTLKSHKTTHILTRARILDGLFLSSQLLLLHSDFVL